jgi:hypothetical protein
MMLFSMGITMAPADGGPQERPDAYAWALTAMTEMEPTSIQWGIFKDETGRKRYLEAAEVVADPGDPQPDRSLRLRRAGCPLDPPALPGDFRR